MKLTLLFTLLFTSFASAQSVPDDPPTYKGLVCMGWTKPEAQAISDGDSQGESLVVNTELTEREKRDLFYARQAATVAIHKENAVENAILNHHHLLFPLGKNDGLRSGPCGDTPMIRSGEYHITQFVPSNPNYPGDGNWMMTGYYHENPSKCRLYFSEMRKKAVKAKYGADADEEYVPITERTK